MRPGDGRRGIALLEVILALAVLGVAGIGWATLAAQTLHTLEATLRREAELERAAQLLERLQAQPLHEIERMAGRRQIDGLTVHVTLLTRSVARMEILVPTQGRATLTTHIYRPNVTDAP